MSCYDLYVAHGIRSMLIIMIAQWDTEYWMKYTLCMRISHYEPCRCHCRFVTPSNMIGFSLAVRELCLFGACSTTRRVIDALICIWTAVHRQFRRQHLPRRKVSRKFRIDRGHFYQISAYWNWATCLWLAADWYFSVPMFIRWVIDGKKLKWVIRNTFRRHNLADSSLSMF